MSENEEDYHSRRSPSGAAYWMTCGQSVQGIPKDYSTPSSFYAAEGTAAHWVVEQCLKDNFFEPEDFVGHIHLVGEHKIDITDEMAEHLWELIEHVRSMVGDKFFEVRVHFDEWADGESGSVDILVIDRINKIVTFIDLKYGHVQVEAANNKQLQCYALGVMQDFPDTRNYPTWRLGIYQPRGSGNPWDFWETTNEGILAFGEEVKLAIIETENHNTPFNPSPKACKYCPRRTFKGCDAHDMWVLDNAGLDVCEFEDGNFVQIKQEGLSQAQKKIIYDNTPYILKWLEALQEQAYSDARNGQPWTGQKLVDGRSGNRYWADEKVVSNKLVEVLGEKAYSKKLISPTDVEKLAKARRKRQDVAELWVDLNEDKLVYKKESRPVLVDESDPRPAFDPLAMFDVELSEDDI